MIQFVWRPLNCVAALDGLAFAPSTRPISDELIAGGIIDWALLHDMNRDHARESLLHRLGLSYLWGDERFDSPRFNYLFESCRFDDLEELGRYFWMVRGEPLTPEQKERIFQFWERCVDWTATLDSPPASLLSELSLLSCYLAALDQRAENLLVAIAPFASVDYHADELIEQLDRLVDTSPGATARVLHVLLEAYQPSYDFEDRLKGLIEKLANYSESRSIAILSVERVRHLPGMVQLYSQLTLNFLRRSQVTPPIRRSTASWRLAPHPEYIAQPSAPPLEGGRSINNFQVDFGLRLWWWPSDGAKTERLAPASAAAFYRGRCRTGAMPKSKNVAIPI